MFVIVVESPNSSQSDNTCGIVITRQKRSILLYQDL